jgi:2-polyprenyl-3-methyl-5-hydroxy-6-metoxy-1,4-benzoquinol methylase
MSLSRVCGLWSDRLVGTHDWSKYIPPEDLKAMVEGGESKCTVKRMNGIVLKPPSLSSCSGGLLRNWALSDSDLDVNYILHAVKA